MPGRRGGQDVAAAPATKITAKPSGGRRRALTALRQLPCDLREPCERTAGCGIERAGRAPRVVECLHHRSEEHTSELQSRSDLVCRLLLEKKKNNRSQTLQPPRTPKISTIHSYLS